MGVRGGHGVAVVVARAEVGVLFALLAKELAEGELAAHGGGRGMLYLYGCFLDAVLAGPGLGFAARSCPVRDLHHLLGSLDAAGGGGGGRRVGEDPDAVDLVALEDDIRVRDFHVLAAGELDVEVVEPAAVEDDGAVPLGADGRGRQLADEERALDADLLPLLRVEAERVERGIWRHVLDGDELRVDAPQDGEVELLVGARGRQRHVERGRRGVGLVVGRRRRCLGLVAARPGFLGRHLRRRRRWRCGVVCGRASRRAGSAQSTTAVLQEAMAGDLQGRRHSRKRAKGSHSRPARAQETPSSLLL